MKAKKKKITPKATFKSRSVQTTFLGQDLFINITGEVNTIVVFRNGVSFRIVLPTE